MESNKSANRVLIVSPEGLFREGLAALVAESARFYVIGLQGTGAGALSTLSSSYADIALIDSDIVDIHFIDLLQGIADISPLTKKLCVISCAAMHFSGTAMLRGSRGLVTAQDTGSHLINALEQVSIGATYISKTVEVKRVFRRGTPAFAEAADPMDTLSTRESQVFQFLVQGIRAKEIAGRLGISAKTVDTFRSSLMRKLNVETKVDLIKYALCRRSYLVAVENSSRGLSVASSA